MTNGDEAYHKGLSLVVPAAPAISRRAENERDFVRTIISFFVRCMMSVRDEGVAATQDAHAADLPRNLRRHLAEFDIIGA